MKGFWNISHSIPSFQPYAHFVAAVHSLSQHPRSKQNHLGDINALCSNVRVFNSQRIGQIANIVLWFDAGFVDGVSVLRHVFDFCIPGDEDVFGTHFEVLLTSIPALLPTH
jgi:hypothetical protein